MQRMLKRTGLAIAAMALAITLAVPATAPAATTVIGKVQLSGGTAPNGSNLCGPQSCTSLNTAVDNAANYVVSSPVNGTVTSWSFRTPSTAAAGTIYALRVVRPAGGNTFRSIASTNSVTIPDTTDQVRGPFAINPGIQIQQGDLIGLKVTSSTGIVPTVSGANTNLYKVFAPPPGDLVDGGPAIAPQQNNPGNQIPIQATITFSTNPPGCPPNCPPPPPPPPGAKPVVSRLSLSPKTFRAASRGASVAVTRRRPPIGTKVSYRLSQAATTTFTLQRATTGRRVNGRCVALRRSNRTRRKCTRYVGVRGSFSRAGSAGANSFKFTGRLRGRKLSPGTYKLTGVARNANGTSRAVTTGTFRIVA